MVKFGCSEAKLLTEAAQRVLRRAIAHGNVEFIVWEHNRGKLPGLADGVGQ